MKKMLEPLRDLVKRGSELRERLLQDRYGNDFDFVMVRWAMDSVAALNFIRINPASMAFSQPEAATRDKSRLETRLAAVESVLFQVETGFIGNIRHVLHADIFDSMISQADELRETGHLIPAAVLGRIIVERWVRDNAEAAKIPAHDTAKVSVLNDQLRKAEKYSQPKWREIQHMCDIGNDAAHGKEPEDADVRLLLDFCRVNCL